MLNFKISASELHNIITDPKFKTVTKTHTVLNVKGEEFKIKLSEPGDEKDDLSEGAKTFIESRARQHVYGYKQPQFFSIETEKGTRVENESIELYNQVYFSQAVKNTERKTIEIAPHCFLTGECDLTESTTKTIVDIKSSWSLETFPETKRVAAKDIKKAGYDWQGRAYMMLWDYEKFDVAYCMVSTPENLLKEWENREIHKVDEIDILLRVTRVNYQRDLELEEKIKQRIIAAGKYFNQVVEEIINDHKGN